jgi:phosphate-selective porin OprO/OprP
MHAIVILLALAQTTPPDGKSELERLKERVAELERKQEGEKKQEPAKPAAGSGDLRVFWSDGLKLESADKKWKFALGGRAQADAYWISEDEDTESAVGDQEDGTRFRRVRLAAGGEIYERVEYKVEVEFSPGTDVEFTDVSLCFKRLWGSGGVRVGHFKEPFTLEEITSDLHITFLERGLPVSAFAPSYNMGIAAYDAFFEERLTATLGVFKDTNPVGLNTNEGEYAVTGRVTGLALDQPDGFLVHLGLGLMRRSPTNDTASFSVRPESRHADTYITTGAINDAHADTRVGLELAATWGPLSFQGEFILADIDSESADDPQFRGLYVMVTWFPTAGDKRAYKKSIGAFDRVKPKRNFLDDGGWGAVEIALRYSRLDLEDGAVNGGVLSDITLGATWYLNPNVKIQANIIRADIDDVGDTTIFQMRFQVDF